MPAFDARSRATWPPRALAGEQQLITLIHCEDDALIEDATARLMAAGTASLRYYPESRPIVSEVVATQRAVAFAEATGAPVYIVHLSSQRALDVCAEAQARGVPVYVETRPLYLHLTRERFEEDEGRSMLGNPRCATSRMSMRSGTGSARACSTPSVPTTRRGRRGQARPGASVPTCARASKTCRRCSRCCTRRASCNGASRSRGSSR